MTAIIAGAIECGAWALLTGLVLWTHRPWDVWFCVVLGAMIRLVKAVDEA